MSNEEYARTPPWRAPHLFISGRPPHCDPDVLHSCGVCEICDKHAMAAQQYRIDNGINFTDSHDPTLKICPARARRWDTCQSWSGNRPWVSGTCEDCGADTLPSWSHCGECFAKRFQNESVTSPEK